MQRQRRSSGSQASHHIPAAVTNNHNGPFSLVLSCVCLPSSYSVELQQGFGVSLQPGMWLTSVWLGSEAVLHNHNSYVCIHCPDHYVACCILGPKHFTIVSASKRREGRVKIG